MNSKTFLKRPRIIALTILINVFLIASLFSQISLDKSYIRVDQFGYLPTATKFAIIAKADKGFNSGKGIDLDISKKLELRNTTTNQLEYEGLASLWNSGSVDAYSGDKGWWFNFTNFNKTGEYFIRSFKVGGGSVDSHPFKISNDVYDDALRAAVNMFYYQRVNQDKTAAYASGIKWVDKAWYEGPNQEKAATYLKDNTKTKNISKGWFDAGDPNKYVTFAADPVHDLLNSYEQHTSMWDKFNLNIPESTNTIPDILDEVKWEIDWIKNMQDESSGGIHIKAGILNDGSYISPPSTDTRRRYYDVVCPSASAVGAGMLAHAAINFRKHNELSTYSADLITRAELAWNYYENAPNKTLRCDNGEIEAGDADGPGEHYPIEHLAEANCAAIYLFALTGKQKYQDFIKANYQQARPWKAEDWGVYRGNQSSALMYYITLSNADPDVTKAIIDKKSSSQKSQGSVYQVNEIDNLYRAKALYPNWGSNSLMSRQGSDNMDFIAYNILPADHKKFRDRAQGIVNYMHGVNPLGICYLSNMYQYGAEFCADEMWHSWFGANTKYDNLDGSNVGPAPGFLSGGFNKTINTQMRVKVGKEVFTELVTAQPTQKAYSNDNTGSTATQPWAYNEPAIYYNSGYVKMLAHFVAEGLVPVATNEQLIDLKYMMIYPNPSNDYVNVSLLDITNPQIDIEIIDSSGRRISLENRSVNHNEHSVNLNVKELHHGIYFIKTKQGNLQKTYKMVKE
jgi:endoglucanase